MKIINLLIWAVCLAALLSCGKSFEDRYSSALEKYRMERVDKNRSILQEILLEMVTLKKFGPGLSSANGIVFSLKGDSVQVFWPREVSVDAPSGYIAASCGDDGRCAFTTGKEAELFNARGSRTGMIGASVKDGITGLLASSDRVVFLKGSFLLDSSWSGDDVKKIIDGEVVTLPGPGIIPRALILASSGRYAINAGNAGLYNLGVVDAASKNILVKNFSNASLKFYFDGSNVFCITGVTGNWTLVKYAIDSKKTDALRRFSVLRDVEFCDGFLAVVKDEGVYFFDYSGKEEMALPFPCDLAGRAGMHPVLKIKDVLYMVDHKLLFTKLMEIKGTTPEFFSVR